VCGILAKARATTVSDKGNKRKHARIPAIIMCDIFVSGTGLLEGRVCLTNYSLGGVAFETKMEIPVKTDVLIFLKNDSKKLEIPGMLMHRKRTMEDVYVYGMRFQGINILKRYRIQKILNGWKKSLLSAASISEET